jgi:hypothetical protein
MYNIFAGRALKDMDRPPYFCIRVVFVRILWYKYSCIFLISIHVLNAVHYVHIFNAGWNEDCTLTMPPVVAKIFNTYISEKAFKAIFAIIGFLGQIIEKWPFL